MVFQCNWACLSSNFWLSEVLVLGAKGQRKTDKTLYVISMIWEWASRTKVTLKAARKTFSKHWRHANVTNLLPPWLWPNSSGMEEDPKWTGVGTATLQPLHHLLHRPLPHLNLLWWRLLLKKWSRPRNRGGWNIQKLGLRRDQEVNVSWTSKWSNNAFDCMRFAKFTHQKSKEPILLSDCISDDLRPASPSCEPGVVGDPLGASGSSRTRSTTQLCHHSSITSPQRPPPPPPEHSQQVYFIDFAFQKKFEYFIVKIQNGKGG